MKKILLFVIIATALVMGITVAQPIQKGANEKVIISFKDKPTDEQLNQLKRLGAKIKYEYRIINAAAATIPRGIAKKIEELPFIALVEDDQVRHVLQQTTPWGIARIDANDAWNISTGYGIRVAVLDTGIDTDHPDLSYIDCDTFVAGTTTCEDDHGHGTHVAGIIAALDNDIGVVGVAPDAGLDINKVCTSGGLCYTSDVIAGIENAVEEGADVISMSFGGKSSSKAEKDALQSAYDVGIVLVASAGNWGGATFPAKYKTVIAVGATAEDDTIPGWSSKKPELVAPGVEVYSTTYDGGYDYMTGTSMAAPHVSGTVALMLTTSPGAYDLDGDGTWDPDEIRSKLHDTAIDIGYPRGWQGYGLVNALSAVS
jgi:subtilisin family serine protease